MPPRRTVTASFPPSLLEQIEQARGLISRSAWLQRAAEEYLVGRGALEQETNTPASSGGGPSSDVIPGESQRGEMTDPPDDRKRTRDPHPGTATSSSPARASGEEPAGGTDARTASQRPSPHSIPGQTTVDEMLASCPNCAGNFVRQFDDENQRDVMVCEDCDYVRTGG